MSSEINLLPQRKGNIFRKEQTLAQVRVVAILCVVLLISLTVAIFLINQINSPSALKSQQESLVNTLTLSKNTAIQQLQLVDKLNHIQAILTNRATLQNNITLVQKQVPPGVTIVGFDLDSKVLTLSVSSSDLTLINKVITNMTTLLRGKKFIKKMTVDDVVADEKTGKYSLTINASL